MQRDGRENGEYEPRRGGRSGERRSAPLNVDFTDEARQRALRRRSHRRHVLIVFYLFLFLAVLGTAAALSLTVLFRITGVRVTGTSRYSEQQIVDASGIKTGDNLFLIRTKEDALAIRRKLPYLGSVRISRRFPDQVQIDVQAANVLGAAAYGTGYVLVGGDGTVLESVVAQPKGCILFRGLKIKKAQPGLPIKFTDSDQESIFKTTMDAVEKGGIGKITAADFSQPARILLVYDGRVSINLGLPADLAYKLKFAKSLLQNNIKSTEKGTLNLSTVSDTNRAYFDPEYGTSPSSTAKK